MGSHPTAYTPRPSLLPSLEMLCGPWKTTTQDHKALGLMREALDAGVDPNGFYRSGGDITALGALAVVASYGQEVPDGKWNSLIEAATILVNAGATPLNDMDQVFNTRTRRFGVDLLVLLAARENAGTLIRDYRGQSVLHTLIVKDVDLFRDAIDIPSSWINAQRQPDLCTPLHLAWSAPLANYGNDQHRQRVMNSFACEQLWDKTQKLFDRGAILELEDGKGESVLSLVERRMKEEGWGAPVWPRTQPVWHAIQAKRIAQSTTPSIGSRSFPRL